MKTQGVLDDWQARHQAIEPAWQRHMGPVHFGHINFRGVIAFEVEAFADALLERPKQARTRLARGALPLRFARETRRAGSSTCAKWLIHSGSDLRYRYDLHGARAHRWCTSAVAERQVEPDTRPRVAAGHKRTAASQRQTAARVVDLRETESSVGDARPERSARVAWGVAAMGTGRRATRSGSAAAT